MSTPNLDHDVIVTLFATKEKRKLVLGPKHPRVPVGRASQNLKKGRAPAEDNALFDCAVISREHAQIHWDTKAIYIEDTGSTHGTFLNDQKIPANDRRKLQQGDLLRFGVAINRTDQDYQPVRVAVGLERDASRPVVYSVPDGTDSDVEDEIEGYHDQAIDLTQADEEDEDEVMPALEYHPDVVDLCSPADSQDSESPLSDDEDTEDRDAEDEEFDVEGMVMTQPERSVWSSDDGMFHYRLGEEVTVSDDVNEEELDDDEQAHDHESLVLDSADAQVFLWDEADSDFKKEADSDLENETNSDRGDVEDIQDIDDVEEIDNLEDNDDVEDMEDVEDIDNSENIDISAPQSAATFDVVAPQVDSALAIVPGHKEAIAHAENAGTASGSRGQIIREREPSPSDAALPHSLRPRRSVSSAAEKPSLLRTEFFIAREENKARVAATLPIELPFVGEIDEDQSINANLGPFSLRTGEKKFAMASPAPRKRKAAAISEASTEEIAWALLDDRVKKALVPEGCAAMAAPATSEVSRPRKKLRGLVQGVGYAALGGITAAAVMFGSLAYTAPAF